MLCPYRARIITRAAAASSPESHMNHGYELGELIPLFSILSKSVFFDASFSYTLRSLSIVLILLSIMAASNKMSAGRSIGSNDHGISNGSGVILIL